MAQLNYPTEQRIQAERLKQQDQIYNTPENAIIGAVTKLSDTYFTKKLKQKEEERQLRKDLFVNSLKEKDLYYTDPKTGQELQVNPEIEADLPKVYMAMKNFTEKGKLDEGLIFKPKTKQVFMPNMETGELGEGKQIPLSAEVIKPTGLTTTQFKERESIKTGEKFKQEEKRTEEIKKRQDQKFNQLKKEITPNQKVAIIKTYNDLVAQGAEEEAISAVRNELNNLGYNFKEEVEDDSGILKSIIDWMSSKKLGDTIGKQKTVAPKVDQKIVREISQKQPDGRIAVFNADTKEFIRWK